MNKMVPVFVAMSVIPWGYFLNKINIFLGLIGAFVQLVGFIFMLKEVIKQKKMSQ